MIVLTGVVFVAYVIVAALSGRAIARRYAGREIAGVERMGVYRHAIIESWCAALLLGVLALVAGVSPTELGLGAPSAQLYPVGAVLAVIAAVCGAGMVLVFAWQGVRLARDPAYQRRAWAELTATGAGPDAVVVHLLIPRTPEQRRRYVLVSLTAGICEEFIFRGVAFAVLAALVPAWPTWTLPVCAAVLFAIPHAYQGIGGIAKTGVMGLVLGYLFAATGFLPACMVVHAVVDLSSAYLAPRGEEG